MDFCRVHRSSLKLFISILSFPFKTFLALHLKEIDHICDNGLYGKHQNAVRNLAKINGYSVLLDLQTKYDRIHVSFCNELSCANISVFIAPYSGQLWNILENISDELACDENQPCGSTSRQIYVVCIPEPLDVLDNYCSDRIHRIKIQDNSEVYLVSTIAPNKPSIGLNWIEVHSLGSCLIVKDVKPLRGTALGTKDVGLLELLQFSSRPTDLLGSVVRIVAQKDPAYTTWFHVEEEHGNAKFIGGTQYQMSLDYQQMLNFTYIQVAGKGWPRSLVRNGTRIDGMGEQLMDKDADIIAMSLTFTIVRAEKLHFLPVIEHAESGIFYRGTSLRLSTRPLLLAPFSENLWIVSMATSVLIFLASMVLVHILRSKVSDEFSIHLASFQEGSSTMAVVLCQGRCSIPPDGSLRIITVTAALTSSLLYMSYAGAFVASVSQPPSALQSHHALKELGFTPFTDPLFPIFSEDFISGEEEAGVLMADSKRLYKGDTSLVEGVLDTSQKLAAIYRVDGFYCIAISLDISGKDLCEVSVVHASQKSKAPESFLVRKGWPYRELFTQKTIVLIERGLTDMYWKSYLRKTKPPCLNEWKYDNGISVSDCGGAFVVILVGAFLALVVLLAEILQKQSLKKH